jgi:glycine/D-amino acid oxidase-like deaminating enzyme
LSSSRYPTRAVAPIIDRVGDSLAVGCGFSGSGFKHAPATGKMFAALTLGQEETIPERFWADRYVIDRFEKGGHMSTLLF